MILFTLSKYVLIIQMLHTNCNLIIHTYYILRMHSFPGRSAGCSDLKTVRKHRLRFGLFNRLFYPISLTYSDFQKFCTTYGNHDTKVRNIRILHTCNYCFAFSEFASPSVHTIVLLKYRFDLQIVC